MTFRQLNVKVKKNIDGVKAYNGADWFEINVKMNNVLSKLLRYEKYYDNSQPLPVKSGYKCLELIVTVLFS